MVDEIEFSRLAKLQYEPDAPDELVQYGTLPLYDRLFDRMTTRNEKTLISTDRLFPNPTTSEDPILIQVLKFMCIEYKR